MGFSSRAEWWRLLTEIAKDHVERPGCLPRRKKRVNIRLDEMEATL